MKFKIGDVVIRMSELLKGYGSIEIGHIGTITGIVGRNILLDNDETGYASETFLIAKEHIFNEFMKKELS